jgi:hypothetical protein
MRKLMMLALVVLLLGLVAVPAAAGPRGIDRPFKADLVGEIEFEFFSRCSPPEEPAPPLVTTESSGTATHMGRVEASWEHCAGPPTGGGITDGELTMTAANGDELVLVYGVDEPTPTDPPNSFPMDIDDGTGRFADAQGTLTVTFEVVPQFTCDPPVPACLDFMTPWPWSGTIEGMISY